MSQPHDHNNCIRPKSSCLFALQYNILASGILCLLPCSPSKAEIFEEMQWGGEITPLYAGWSVLDTT